jgi:hypothetical protein
MLEILIIGLVVIIGRNHMRKMDHIGAEVRGIGKTKYEQI